MRKRVARELEAEEIIPYLLEDPEYTGLSGIERSFYASCLSKGKAFGYVSASPVYIRNVFFAYDNVSLEEAAEVRDRVLSKCRRLRMAERNGKPTIYIDAFPSMREVHPMRLEWHKLSATLRPLILKRDNYTCRRCQATDRKLEVDHIIPIAKGGTNDETNLQTLCKPCNRRKWAH